LRRYSKLKTPLPALAFPDLAPTLTSNRDQPDARKRDLPNLLIT
jgi:hypothetical protein